MTRGFGFGAIVLGIIGLFVILFYTRAVKPAATPESTTGPASADALRSLIDRPRLYFRNTRVDASYGRVAAVSLDNVQGPRIATGLACDRLDVAGGTGVCLAADRGVLTTYSALIFDERSFSPVRTVPLSGIPSRVRVSPNGELAGITVFVSGHSYSQTAFSTQTILIDTRTGETRADLESFTVERQGRPFKNQDFNFWGVTFSRDSNTFYATVSSGGVFYLVRADAAARRAQIIGEGVECPALSPDNLRLAFKKRETINGRLIWRLALYDLASGRQDLVPGETRSVDDQVEWLDDERVLYATPNPDRAGSMIVSVVAVNGGPAETLLTDAYSPSVP